MKVSLRADAQNSGFASEATTFTVPPHVLARDLLARFETEVDRVRDMAAAPPANAPAPTPRPVVVPVAPAKPIAKPKPSAGAAGALKQFVPKAPPKADGDGNIKITFLGAGIEIEGRPRPKAGDTVALPAAHAMRVVQSGHADFAEAS